MDSRYDEERKKFSSSSSLSLENVQISNMDFAQLNKNIHLCYHMLFLKSAVEFKDKYVALDYLA